MLPVQYFGDFACPLCDERRSFVAYEPNVVHVKDAECITCGYQFAEVAVEKRDENTGELYFVKQCPLPQEVIDAEAKRARDAVMFQRKHAEDVNGREPPLRRPGRNADR